jgi:hypothetical protein
MDSFWLSALSDTGQAKPTHGRVCFLKWRALLS